MVQFLSSFFYAKVALFFVGYMIQNSDHTVYSVSEPTFFIYCVFTCFFENVIFNNMDYPFTQIHPMSH